MNEILKTNPQDEREKTSLAAGSFTIPKNEGGINEDRVIIANGFYGIADGAGGSERGDIASEAVFQAISNTTTRLDTPSLQEVQNRANAILKEARNSIGLHEVRNKINKGESYTTLCAVYPVETEGGEMYLNILNVGDSRVLIIGSDGKIRFQTLDQGTDMRLSLTNQQRRANQLRRGEYTSKEQDPDYFDTRNLIARRVSSNTTDEPEVYQVKLQEGDRVLVVSDGVIDNLTLSEIENFAKAEKNKNLSPDDFSKKLCEYAYRRTTTDINARSKKDDISAVCLNYGTITQNRESRQAQDRRVQSGSIEQQRGIEIDRTRTELIRRCVDIQQLFGVIQSFGEFTENTTKYNKNYFGGLFQSIQAETRNDLKYFSTYFPNKYGIRKKFSELLLSDDSLKSSMIANANSFEDLQIVINNIYTQGSYIANSNGERYNKDRLISMVRQASTGDARSFHLITNNNGLRLKVSELMQKRR